MVLHNTIYVNVYTWHKRQSNSIQTQT